MLEPKVILRAGSRRLHTPLSLVAASLSGHFSSDPVLLCEHPGGDHDTIVWPAPRGERERANWRLMLRSALYDARECGVIPNIAAVILPDGSEFGIDAGWWVGLPRAIRATPITGRLCFCRPGQARDNCPACEGTGMQIDFAAIRAA